MIDTSEPAPKRHRAAVITSITALLLLTGAAAVWATTRQPEPTAAASPSAEPSASPSITPSPTPSPSPSLSPTPAAPPRTKTTVVEPAKLVGRKKTTDQYLMDLRARTIGGMYLGSGKKETAAYGSVDSRNAAMFVAVASSPPLTDPEATVAQAIRTWFPNDNFHATDPGPLGGTARCASVKSGQTDVTECLWASANVFGLIYFFFLSPAKAEAQFIQARGEIEVPA